jgi:hypothetical protein
LNEKRSGSKENNMTRSQMLWLGALGLLIVVSAIDRHATRRRLEDLGRKYDAEVARAANERNVLIEQPALAALAASAMAAPPQAAVGQPAAGEPSSPDPQKSGGGKEPTPSDYARQIDAVFSEERPDGSWSHATETKIANLLAPLAVGGARVHPVACHRTLCKLKLEHTSDGGIRDLVDQVFNTEGLWGGGAMVTMRDTASPEGTFAHVVYIAKAGESVPVLAN